MALDKIRNLKPTTSRTDVPLLFRECYVETGFRHMHQPWSYYMWSLFQKHNECMNCWTHLIGLGLALSRWVHLSNDYHMLSDPYMWPLGAGLLTMVLMYIFSTGAHCFQSKSEFVHYAAFMVDYAGIGLYGLGSVILHHWYCHDHSFDNTLIQTYAVPLGVVLGAAVCFCCSISKVMYTRPYPFARKVWQLSSVGSIYSLLILPIVYRLFLYVHYNQWNPGLDPHMSHMLWFLTAGFFFGSDIPQRFFPGRFDFLGHSHQIFHVCIVMTTERQLDAVALDLLTFKEKELPEPTFWNSYGAVLLLLVFNLCVVAAFSAFVNKKINKEKQNKDM